MIADPALLGKWQPGDDVAYLLMYEGDLTDRVNPEMHTCQMLPSRLSEALPVPILQEWAEMLWEAGISQDLIDKLTTCGDCPAGFRAKLTETIRAELISRLLKEGKIRISMSQ